MDNWHVQIAVVTEFLSGFVHIHARRRLTQMPSVHFDIVDVFAETRYAGNQLAVVSGAKVLDSLEMQRIANEMHFSETTFVMSDKPKDGGYDVRIFTPAAEVPFAGHPTLGTAYVIRNRIGNASTETITLNVKVGKIPVTFEKDRSDQEILWMTQVPPVFGKKLDIARVARVLGLATADFDDRFPIQEISTGLPFIIVPLKSLDAIKRAKVNMVLQHDLGEETSLDFLVFSPETYGKENDLNVRVFVDILGIPEDPATGSGNGCLAGFLSKYEYFGTDAVNVRVEQGYEINRRSILRLRARRKNEEIEVKVGGKVIPVAEGELLGSHENHV